MPGNVQSIGTSTEQLVFLPDLIAEGIHFIALKNLDATNYIEISRSNTNASGYEVAKMGPGDVNLISVYDWSAGGAPAYYGKAHTGACNLLMAGVGIV